MSDSAYPGLTIAENIFKDLVWTPFFNTGLDYLMAQNPILNVWPLRPLVKFIVNQASDSAYSAFKMATDVEAIKLSNATHQQMFDQAMVKLKIIAGDYGKNSNEYQMANKEAQNSLAIFVRFVG